MSKTHDAIYKDRNAAALALGQLAEQLDAAIRGGNHRVSETSYGAVWTDADHEDADGEKWGILYVTLPTGQVSWHIPKPTLEDTDIPYRESVEWDGHDRMEKNGRLRDFATGKM